MSENSNYKTLNHAKFSDCTDEGSHQRISSWCWIQHNVLSMCLLVTGGISVSSVRLLTNTALMRLLTGVDPQVAG